MQHINTACNIINNTNEKEEYIKLDTLPPRTHKRHRSIRVHHNYCNINNAQLVHASNCVDVLNTMNTMGMVNMHELDVIWNNCYRRVFNCCWRESVKSL